MPIFLRRGNIKDMSTVTIPKKEYKELVEKKLRYEYVRHIVEDDIFSPPSVKNIKEIVRSFNHTKKYSQEFLTSLEKGLGRSSYFRI